MNTYLIWLNITSGYGILIDRYPHYWNWHTFINMEGCWIIKRIIIRRVVLVSLIKFNHSSN